MTQPSLKPNTFITISSHVLFFVDYVLLNLQTLLLYLLYFVRVSQPPKQARKPKDKPVVVISGANSGIGLETTKTLYSLGYTVFAGCRNNKAKEFLASLNKKDLGGAIIPVQLDVCEKDQINSTYKQVKDFLNSNKDFYLAGVISNAGGGVFAPLELCNFKEMQDTFKLNYFGALELVQRFLYLLKKDKGRVVFIGSIASKSLTKNFGLYSAAKAALRSTSVIINAELSKFDVQAVLIEPGAFKTRAMDLMLQKSSDPNFYLHQDKKEDTKNYGEDLRKFGEKFKLLTNLAHPPFHVTYHIRHALEAPIVKSTYLVGWDAYLFGALDCLPDVFAEQIRNII